MRASRKKLLTLRAPHLKLWVKGALYCKIIKTIIEDNSMNISFEKSTPVSGTITIQLVKADYAEKSMRH